MYARGRIGVIMVVAGTLLAGCAGPAQPHEAIRSYYRYDFGAAREALRPAAIGAANEQALLDDLRLGLTALADGDTAEAERALEPAFDLLSTAGLNADRTTAAVLLHEGVRVWKGEPFEQALAYHYVATLYAVLGDWDNTRAAAANALFRLTDFGADMTTERIVGNAVRNSAYLQRGYTAVDTDFALGFLVQALGADLSGAGGSDRLFDAALAIDRSLTPLVRTLRARSYDTLLFVDYGKGPTKIASGPDGVLADFVPQDTYRGPLIVEVSGRPVARVRAVCDVNRMAVDHRWRNLEDVRLAKQRIGDTLLASGWIVAASGRGNHGGGRPLLAGGLMLTGLLLKTGARADTRYLELLPQLVYVVPLRLEGRCEIVVRVRDGVGSRRLVADVEPGTPDRPRAVYVRLLRNVTPGPWVRMAHR